MSYLDFPNVPDVPGVPPLPRFPSSVAQLASFAGNIAGQNLSVTGVASGLLYQGAALAGPGLIDGTKILSQISGPAGGIGSYLVDTPQTFAGNITSEFNPPDFSDEDSPAAEDSADLPADDNPQWGIYDTGGNPVVIADTVATVGFKNDFNICDYPVEEGGFQTYNKVYVPYDVRVRFASGGSLSNRQALVNSIKAIQADLKLYDVVTPEEVYSSVNVIHRGLERAPTRGLGLMQIEVWLEQVKADATAAFSDPSTSKPIANPKAPAATSMVNNGTVQATAPTQSQSAAFLDLNQLGKIPRLQ